jgi:Spy/CpxP family protein refolding chaperone
MSDPVNANPAGSGGGNDPSGAAPGGPPPAGGLRRRCSGRHGLKVLVIGSIVALVGAGIYWRTTHRPYGHGVFSMQAAVDPAEAARRLDRGLDRAMGYLDATPEQRSKVRGIAQAAMRDLLPLREDMRAARGKLTDLLRAETIDRARLEQLRTEQAALFDTASRRMTQVMAETAEVLTPAQRQKLIQRLDERRRWGWRG